MRATRSSGALPGFQERRSLTMTDAKQASGYRRIVFGLILILIAAPSGYLYLTGRQDRLALERDKARLLQEAEALQDSLDGARTQLLLVAAQSNLRAGDFEVARTFTSEFFDRVDSRTRQPGGEANETVTRMGILAFRDRAITALSQRSLEVGTLLQELATLHLALAYPELDARMPRPPPEPGGEGRP